MSIDPILHSNRPAYNPKWSAHDGDVSRRATETVQALFPARSRPPCNRNQSSQSSIQNFGLSRRSQPDSLRNSTASSNSSTPRNSISENEMATHTGVKESTLSHKSSASSSSFITNAAPSPRPASATWPQTGPPHTPGPSPTPRRATSFTSPNAYASDVWRIQCLSERKRTEQLKQALIQEREGRRTQDEIIEGLRMELDFLRAALRQHRCRDQHDARSVLTDGTISRKQRFQQKMQMIKEDLRDNRMVQRLRHRRGRSEDRDRSGKRSRSRVPRQAFLSSSMG